jgi:hypothetical protein
VNNLKGLRASGGITPSVMIGICVEYRHFNLTAVGIALAVMIVISMTCAVYRNLFTACIAYTVAVKILVHRAGLSLRPKYLRTGADKNQKRH